MLHLSESSDTGFQKNVQRHLYGKECKIFTCVKGYIPLERIFVLIATNLFKLFQSRYNSSMPEGIWTLLLTLTTSTLLAGGLLSGTTSKYWFRFFSKKQLLQLSQVVNISSVVVLSLIVCHTWSYEAMIVGRFLLVSLPVYPTVSN